MRLVIENKKELIESLIDGGRCYYLPKDNGIDPFGKPEIEATPLFVLFQRLTTAVLIAPFYDRHSKSHQLLYEMLYDAINFEGVMVDYEVLNAISYIPPQKPDDPRTYVGQEMTMAFVLMLMFETYINPNPPLVQKTFLSACRDFKLELKKGKDYESQDLLALLNGAIDSLQIRSAFIEQAVLDWSKDGTFTVNGIKYSKDSDDPRAVYLNVVRKLKDRDKGSDNNKLLLNSLISLAVGMEKYLDRIEAVDISERRLESVKYLERVIEDETLRNRVMDEGEEARYARMQTLVTKDEVKPKLISDEGKQFFQDVFNDLPDEVIRIYKAKKYRFAYTQDENLVRLYPEGTLPGFTEDECKVTRESVGANLSRYNLCLIARGIVPEITPQERENAERHGHALFEGRSRDIVFAQQTLLHESLHMAFNRLPLAEEHSDLYKETLDFKVRAVEVFNAVQTMDLPELDQQSLYLNGRLVSVKELLNLSNDYYTVYKGQALGDENEKKNAVIEEALANVFGLVHSLFSESNKPGFNPFIGYEGCSKKLEPLRSLVKDMNELVERISFRLDGIDIGFRAAVGQTSHGWGSTCGVPS